MNKAVLIACALYAASCSGISLGDRNGFRVYRPARGRRLCEHFGGYKTINRIPLPLPLPLEGAISQNIGMIRITEKSNIGSG